MLLFLFYFFLAYLFYRLVFNFILPIYRTTRQVRREFRNMHERMNGNAGAAAGSQQKSNTSGKPKKDIDAVGDYIDFEEVKE